MNPPRQSTQDKMSSQELQLRPKTKGKTGKGFLDLPAEIRNRIYHLALVKDRNTIAQDQTKDQDRTTPYEHTTKASLYQPALLMTNRTIREEALPIYYAKNQFWLFLEFIDNDQCIIKIDAHQQNRDDFNPTTDCLTTYSTYKTALDRCLATFTRPNGVDHSGSRLQHIRELRIQVEYFTFDLVPGTTNDYGWSRIDRYEADLSAYTTWGRPERENLKEELVEVRRRREEGEEGEEEEEEEEEEQRDDDKGAVVVEFRRKVLPLKLRRASFMATVLESGRIGPLKEKDGIQWVKGWGVEVMDMAAKVFPMATKSCEVYQEYELA